MKMIALVFTFTAVSLSAHAQAPFSKKCHDIMMDALHEKFVASAPADNPGSFRIMSTQILDIYEESAYVKTYVLTAGNRQEGAPRNTGWYTAQIVCDRDSDLNLYDTRPLIQYIMKYRAG